MSNAHPDWLTTGAVARLCSVTPDTVQKWIKSGRIAAQRTAGGHYRLAAEDIEPFIMACGKPRRWYAPPPRDCSPQPLRCWEYFAESGEIRRCCKQCVVYRVRASWCFEVLAIPGADHGRAFCRSQGGCTECAYYRQIAGMSIAVLVISADAVLCSNLEAGDDNLEVRCVSSPYDAAVAVGSFRPAFVVLDTESVTDGQGILDHLMRDARVPGLRIVLCQSSRNRVRVLRERLIANVRKPFDRAAIASIIQAMAIERRSVNNLYAIDSAAT